MRMPWLMWWSANNKRREFQNVVDTVDPDIIEATETWLNHEVPDSEIGAPDVDPGTVAVVVD